MSIRVVAFGEILWDIFDEKKVIGGAPFNFAAHLASLGAESYIVSSLGNDENGRDAIAEAKAKGIRTDHISFNRFPTGYCRVTLNNGIPSYDLAKNVAYDHIGRQCPQGRFDALYMGTLAMRTPESRMAFDSLVRCTTAKEIFFDVNIRGNFYSRELLHSLLSCATILKVSAEELPVLGTGSDEIRACLNIAAKYRNLKYIALTLGPDGAAVIDCRAKTVLYSDKPHSKPVSTVGAGDSFAACFIYNLLAGQPVSVCLDRAVKLSDYVVTQLEAVPEYPAELLSEIK